MKKLNNKLKIQEVFKISSLDINRFCIQKNKVTITHKASRESLDNFIWKEFKTKFNACNENNGKVRIEGPGFSDFPGQEFEAFKTLIRFVPNPIRRSCRLLSR